MRFYYIYCVVLGTIIYACSKQQEQPLSCDSKTVVYSLLGTGKLSESTPVYFSRSLSNFQAQSNLDKSLSCSATLVLQSNLNQDNILKLPVKYIVYPVNNSSVSNTSDLKVDDASKSKMKNWLIQLNGLIRKLGDYQFTPYGALYVIKDNEMEQTLYFNGQLVNPNIHNYQVNIEKNYLLGNKYVFLIGSYSGGTMDIDTQNNRLIEIAPNKQYKVTPLFAYRSDGIVVNQQSLYINAFDPERPYVESTDLPVYKYESGNLIVVHNSKSYEDYQHKFSTMRPRDIINIAKADKCFDEEDKVLDVSHACGYGVKYCFMYKALKNPPHDEYYQELSQACTVK